MHNYMHKQTIFVSLMLGFIYIIVNINNPFDVYQSVFYYCNLSLISYATETYSIIRKSRENILESLYFENNILFPIFGLPFFAMIIYAAWFGVITILSSISFITYVSIAITICEAYNRQAYNRQAYNRQAYNRISSVLLPVLLTSLPLETISLHILIVALTKLILIK